MPSVILLNFCVPLGHKGPFFVWEAIACEGGCVHTQEVRNVNGKGGLHKLPIVICEGCIKQGGRTVCAECSGRMLYGLNQLPNALRDPSAGVLPA